ncbi:MAG: hypothetical protein J6C82_04730 [Clostridia bacterium]|nr:hypothetical protein [Clostridia bacterium]
MHSALSIINYSSVPVSVYIDDEPLFTDILGGTETRFKNVDIGSAAVCAFNNRKKKLFDLWLPFSPKRRHVLEIYNNFCIFI